MQAEQAALEEKNHQLSTGLRTKSQALAHTSHLYQALKAQVMASHVATAAGDEAEMTLQTARGDRFIDRLPGTRSGTANFSQMGGSHRMSGPRPHNRADSRSSGSSGQQLRGNGMGQTFASQLQGRGLGRTGAGGEFSMHYLFAARLTCPKNPALARPVSRNVADSPSLEAPAGTPTKTLR
jgi:hypothetical protein